MSAEIELACTTLATRNDRLTRGLIDDQAQPDVCAVFLQTSAGQLPCVPQTRKTRNTAMGRHVVAIKCRLPHSARCGNTHTKGKSHEKTRRHKFATTTTRPLQPSRTTCRYSIVQPTRRRLILAAPCIHDSGGAAIVGVPVQFAPPTLADVASNGGPGRPWLLSPPYWPSDADVCRCSICAVHICSSSRHGLPCALSLAPLHQCQRKHTRPECWLGPAFSSPRHNEAQHRSQDRFLSLRVPRRPLALSTIIGRWSFNQPPAPDLTKLPARAANNRAAS